MMDETVRHQRITRPHRRSAATPDEALIEGFIAECQSMTGGRTQECVNYAFELTRVDNLTSPNTHSDQSIIYYDEAIVSGFITECQSMVSSYGGQDCLGYALGLASPYPK